MNKNIFTRAAACCWLLTVILFPLVVHAQQTANSPTANNAVAVALKSAANLPADKGGELSAGTANVLVDRYGVCRWLDNAGTDNFFVPTGSLGDWQAFIDNRPVAVAAANCCPAQTVILTASDGQTSSFNLDTGREGSTTQLGQRTLSHDFTLTRVSDGATWIENVAENFTCTSGAWTGQGAVITGAAPPVTVEEPETPPVTGDPAECLVTETEAVTASWTGTWRRSASSNTTYSSSGFGSPQHQYIEIDTIPVRTTSNGNGDRSTAVFTLTAPAKNTHVKVTALYSYFSGFSDGVTPKVAEFEIADGQVITQANTPAVAVFWEDYRMGHKFVMTNSKVYMPSYDSSPNLRSLTVEYTKTTTTDTCNDMLVFGYACRSKTGPWGWAGACISNGSSCLSGTSTSPSSVLPMDESIHSGTFCSSIAGADSSTDGAIVDFDLSATFAGRSGSAVVYAPVNMYKGVRTQDEANQVLRGDISSIRNGFQRLDTVVPADGNIRAAVAPVGAMKLVIPNIDQDATITFYDGHHTQWGIFNNGSENMSLCPSGTIYYSGATKTMSVAYGVGCRWKKTTSQYPIYGDLVNGTYGSWIQQKEYGNLNGKVWSQVRVVMPAPAECGSVQNTCNVGTATNPQNTCYPDGAGGEICTGGTWQCQGQKVGDLRTCSYTIGGVGDTGSGSGDGDFVDNDNVIRTAD